MTTAEARKAGFEVVRGDYTGTTDNRIDRWYVQRLDSPVVDRTGAGFRTRHEALQHLEQYLGSRA